ncbi:MAG TPA: VOC family protein [Candidatus Acidoferrum sp.]|nr:VOC family protein [Candidatus Acidoferrum sp.]
MSSFVRHVRAAIWHSRFECSTISGGIAHEREAHHPGPAGEEIEPLIPFWVDALGFTRAVEVPDGGKIGFVIFQKGSVEVMYQTYASVEKDAPPSMGAEARKGPTYLYMEVDNLDAVLAAMKQARLVMPVRTAFYGMKEFAVQDPGGHFVTFAQPVAAAQQ